MKIADIRRLQQRKHREESGFFLVEGEHLVLELQKAAARDPRLRASQLYVTPEHAQWESPFTRHVISPRDMAQISQTPSPQGIVAVVPLLTAPAAMPGERAIYLHGIQDPGNLGTILRTLAWFGGFRCLLGPGSVDLHNGKTVRASMGGLFHVPVESAVPLEALAQRFPRIACLGLQGAPISAPAFRDFDCYLFGSEAGGLPPDTPPGVLAHAFTIAGQGGVESLNLATAVNICQYELHRRSAPGL
ncbi:MAG: RNA methyltransferase [Steroidobacteraceae bacterium]